MATLDLGKIKQVWRGTYNNGTAYVVDDLVEYTDTGITSTYICVANSTGNAPSSSGTAHASWNYVAKGTADVIPSQSGNSGKFLTSNGSAASWGTVASVGQAHNLVINGAMQVHQYSDNSGSATSTTASYQTVDRFEMRFADTDENPTQGHVDVASGTTPYTLGFRQAFSITNGNQTSGAGADDQIYIRHRIESQNLAESGWNYISSSSYVTLSFWVKSSVAQNFFGYLEAQQGTAKMYPFQTGSLSANTWTKVTKTIPGNSDLTFARDNSIGMGLVISPFMGTNLTDNSASVDTWKAHSNSVRTPDHTSTWYTTNDATFQITGVQLEIGNTANDFAHESYGDALAKCQRYYVHVVNSVWNNVIYQTFFMPVTMRANPSITSTATGPNAVGKTCWYGKRNTGTNTGGVSFNWTASAEL